MFHSKPVIVGPTSDDGCRFAQDAGTSVTGAYGDRSDSHNTFRDNYLHRRKVLYVGADDALFHAFDGGVYNGDQTSYPSGSATVTPYLNTYSLGSGREVFAYAPRAGMNKPFELAHASYHDWSIDGAPTSADVCIDVQRTGLIPEGARRAEPRERRFERKFGKRSLHGGHFVSNRWAGADPTPLRRPLRKRVMQMPPL